MNKNSNAKIIVAIRARPLTKKEISKNEQEIVDFIDNENMILKEQREKVDLTKYIEEHNFSFDAVFSQQENNHDVYNRVVSPLVESAFAGAKVTCFAYGQTGSGKTFTMMGNTQLNVPGIFLLAGDDIFYNLQSNPSAPKLKVGVSFYEIYCGKAYDLLNIRTHCPIRVDAKENVHIVGLKEIGVKDVEGLMSLVKAGMGARVTGSTGANQDSSRSHAILQITLRDASSNSTKGKISFIDLAGSERGADVTDTNKQTRMDGAEINKSLLALKECIRALDLGGKHLPFRGSKLTLVLKDSFVGNCRTAMIGNISPSLSSCEHTLNTLRYADRVKELKKGDKGEKGKGMSKEDRRARELMLPRRNENSNKIALKSAVTTEDNLVFEDFNKNKNSKFSTKEKNNYGHKKEIRSFQGGFSQDNSRGDIQYKNKEENFFECEDEMDDVEFEVMETPKNKIISSSKPNVSQIINRKPQPVKLKPVDQRKQSPMNGTNKNWKKQDNEQNIGKPISFLNKPNSDSNSKLNSITSFSRQQVKESRQKTRNIDEMSTNSGNGYRTFSNDRHFKPINNFSGKHVNLEDEEDEIKEEHRNHIDDLMIIIKEEMKTVNNNPLLRGPNEFSEYFEHTMSLLERKESAILRFKKKLSRIEKSFNRKIGNETMNQSQEGFFDLKGLPNDRNLLDNLDD